MGSDNFNSGHMDMHDTTKAEEGTSLDDTTSQPLSHAMDAPSLRTWKLLPTAIPSSLWALSTFATVAYVRAPDPIEARRLAAERFQKYESLGFGSNQAPSPCLDPDLVCCVEVQDERYEVLQRPCVLTESECRELIKRAR